jgi:Flp pilus assembly protein TadD
VTAPFGSQPDFPGGLGLVVAGFLFCATLLACSTTGLSTAALSDLAPLQVEGGMLPVEAVAELAPTPDLLAVDEEMREFVALYAGDEGSHRRRLMMLHRAIRGGGTLNLQYDPFAEGTAREVFHGGAANCLSYANLFVAMAREAGLDARYQWLEVRPQWTRMGERIALRLHVNVVVHLPRGGQYMVDIDPLPSRDITGSQEISDRDAQALYHNNIAMNALAQEDTEQAWIHAVRALQLSPATPHLWVNLGAIYRLAGQHREAERSYLYALQLDPWGRSAMTNLEVLYRLEGREAERSHWAQRVERYRETNPYYHAWLGDQAGESHDWRRALEHYEEALDLSPQDARLLYAAGLIHYQLDNFKAAERYIERAIDSATLRSEIETYRAQLEEVKRSQVAGL